MQYGKIETERTAQRKQRPDNVRTGTERVGESMRRGTQKTTLRSTKKSPRKAHPNRERDLRVLALYPYRKAAAEVAEGRVTSELARARTFVARVDQALAVLAAEERNVLLDKTAPLPDGSLPTGFDRYERAACEKSAYYRLRAKALEKFAVALFGKY